MEPLYSRAIGLSIIGLTIIGPLTWHGISKSLQQDGESTELAETSAPPSLTKGPSIAGYLCQPDSS